MPESYMKCTMPVTGNSVDMVGWKKEKRGDDIIYVGPDGEEYECTEYAYKAVEELQKRGRQFRYTHQSFE